MLAFLSRLTCGATFLAISLVLFCYGFRGERVTCEHSEGTCLIMDHGLFDGSTDTVRIPEIVEHRSGAVTPKAPRAATVATPNCSSTAPRSYLPRTDRGR